MEQRAWKLAHGMMYALIPLGLGEIIWAVPIVGALNEMPFFVTPFFFYVTLFGGSLMGIGLIAESIFVSAFLVNWRKLTRTQQKQ